MPGDISNLTVKFARNDFAKQFILKCSSVDRNISNNFVTKGILSAAGDLAGKDLSIGFENYTLQGMIQATDPDSYPNLAGVDTSKWQDSTAKEMALAQAARAWGPDADNGFDTFQWGPRDIPGLISKYSAGENVDQNGQEKYDFTLEISHFDLYIGDE